MEIQHRADSFVCMKGGSERDTCRINSSQRTEVHTHCLAFEYFWEPLHQPKYSHLLLIKFLTAPHKTAELKHINTHTSTSLSLLVGSHSFQFSRCPRLKILVTPVGQRVIALMAEHCTLRQKTGVIFQNNTTRGERKNLRGGLESHESHLLCALQCLTLNFFAFYSHVTHTRPPPTLTACMPR